MTQLAFSMSYLQWGMLSFAEWSSSCAHAAHCAIYFCFTCGFLLFYSRRGQSDELRACIVPVFWTLWHWRNQFYSDQFLVDCRSCLCQDSSSFPPIYHLGRCWRKRISRCFLSSNLFANIYCSFNVIANGERIITSCEPDWPVRTSMHCSPIDLVLVIMK